MAQRFETVAAVYRAATGLQAHSPEYVVWCEAKVNVWRELVRANGQNPDGCFTLVRPDGSRLSYLDWLIGHEGLRP